MRYTAPLAAAFASLASAALAAPVALDGYAVVNADGTLARGIKSYSAQKLDTGHYRVLTGTSVKTCGYSVTAGSSDATVAAPAIATAVREPSSTQSILISTFDHHGARIDSGFHLIVRCSDIVFDTAAAVVNADGTLVRGIGTASASRTGMGAYTVAFQGGTVSTACVYTASVGLSTTSGVSEPGFVTVAGVSGGTIAVQTYDKRGNPLDLGFHVTTSCPR